MKVVILEKVCTFQVAPRRKNFLTFLCSFVVTVLVKIKNANLNTFVGTTQSWCKLRLTLFDTAFFETLALGGGGLIPSPPIITSLFIFQCL